MKTNRFKFRAWDILDKKMLTLHHLCLFPESDGRTIAVMAQNANLYPMDRVIVMQCTSLKDKHGTLIFEGDIIRSERWKTLHEIKWGLRIEARLLKREGHDWPPQFLECFDSDDIEVIGSIHDNPELLKGGNI